jgi:hypothetical protein
MVSEWIRYTTSDQNVTENLFFIPFSSTEEFNNVLSREQGANNIPYDLLQTKRICQSALMTILGIGRRFWQKCKAGAYNGFLEHALSGRPSNRARQLEEEELYNDLDTFFEETKQFAKPVATLVTRQKVYDHSSSKETIQIKL